MFVGSDTASFLFCEPEKFQAILAPQADHGSIEFRARLLANHVPPIQRRSRDLGLSAKADFKTHSQIKVHLFLFSFLDFALHQTCLEMCLVFFFFFTSTLESWERMRIPTPPPLTGLLFGTTNAPLPGWLHLWRSSFFSTLCVTN